jgi:hypothetical protein
MQVWARAVSLPGRALAPVIERLKSAGVAEPDAAVLAEFHGDVVVSLTGGGGDQAELDRQLESALPRLKRAAGLGGSGETESAAAEAADLADLDAGAANAHEPAEEEG